MSQAVLSLNADREPTFPSRVERRRAEVSDEPRHSRLTEVESRVREAFAASPIHAHRQLQVAQSGESLHLHGRLESFYYKQLAQEIVRTICRNVQVVNEIAVDD